MNGAASGVIHAAMLKLGKILNPEAFGIKTPLAGFFLGMVLLAMGRRLFWLFVGVVGFIFAFDVVRRLLPQQPHNTALAIALAAGLIGALLAVSLQKIAIATAGFLAGGHLAPQVLRALGIATHLNHWVLFVIGGITGAVLMRLAFGFTLIVLSSLIGADLILQALHVKGRWFSILFVLISAAGFLFQSGLARPGHRGSKDQR